jgi:hypothetical protein
MGALVDEKVGISRPNWKGYVFECLGGLSRPTICDLKRERYDYQKKTNSIMTQLEQSGKNKAYFSWLIKDYKTAIQNISSMIEWNVNVGGKKNE